jgi:eukaryotic-like serine/threonine-protein kinase
VAQTRGAPPVEEPRPSEPPRPRQIGDKLAGTYRITRRIGSGGMADVFEVEHLRLGSKFAAKVLRGTSIHDPSARRFLREARLLASLRSDHIVTVFDLCGPDEETPFYVMERLQGSDLRQLLKGVRHLSIARAVKLVLDACRGVSVAHGAGIVHRDLKPENLFVTHRDTGEEVCKLLDFGVVKSEQGSSTQHGALVGTLRYMAPEQIQHAGVVGPRSDVCSLGSILYECLAGRPPYEADSFERLAYRILNEAPEPLGALRTDLPAGLEDVVMRALARDPARRQPSAQAFADALEPFARGSDSDGASQTTETRPASHLSPNVSRPGPRSWAAAALAVALVLCLVALAWSLTGEREGTTRSVVPPPPAPATAPRELAAIPAAPATPSAVPAAPETESVARQHATAAPRATAESTRGRAKPTARSSSPPVSSARPQLSIEARNPYD